MFPGELEWRGLENGRERRTCLSGGELEMQVWFWGLLGSLMAVDVGVFLNLEKLLIFASRGKEYQKQITNSEYLQFLLTLN